LVGFSNDDKPISEFISKIEDHLYVLLNAIGPLGFAIFITFVPEWWRSNSMVAVSTLIEFLHSILFLTWNPVVGSLVFLALTVIGAVGQAKDTKALKASNMQLEINITDKKENINQLEAINAKIDRQLGNEIENNYQLAEELIDSYKKLAHLWICQIFNELELGVMDRISIYYLDNTKENMILLDRFAKNYDFNSQGRPYFKRNQGVMGKVLSEGTYFENNIPEFSKKNTHYYKYLESKYDFSRDVSSRLRMKSRTIGGFAIEDAQGHHIGVIIFESLDIEGFIQNRLKEIVKRENHRLVEFITDTSERDLRPTNGFSNQLENQNEQKVA
jgi:cell division protein FtsB